MNKKQLDKYEKKYAKMFDHLKEILDTVPLKETVKINLLAEVQKEYGNLDNAIAYQLVINEDNSSEKYKLLTDSGFYEAAIDYQKIFRYRRRLDSEPVVFDGDIIITDPCYIMNWDNETDDWSLCDYGDHLEELGLKTFMCRDTLYGDWSCTVFDENGDEELGKFCADAGLVAVLDLSEILKYNPKFDYHKTKTWTTAWIKDFIGTVQFIITKDEEVQVVGHGQNKVTGEPINFRSCQTGF